MNIRTDRSPATASRVAAAAVATLGVVASLLMPIGAQAAPAGPGESQATAAASCWEIKQQTPAAPSGAYWLVTPQLKAPQQFYCDQVTDGGGWVLIGRGRENWTQSNAGRLTARDVWQTPTGVAAFNPAQLDVDTVTGLLNNGDVDQLADGVRLRRATNVAGTTWQEGRFTYGTNRDDWSWQFMGLQRVATWKFDGVSGTGGTTDTWGNDTTFRRVDNAITSGKGWERGFMFGSSARGNPAADSYMWASTTSAGYPRPFTQVYLRPKLMSAEIFTAIPDAGLPASAIVSTAQSFPMTSPWGVSGLGAGGNGELATEVADFVESNGIMYVGGNFRYVQRSSSGADQVEQSYLAAFDVTTGEWISSFRPTLNNQVKALAVLPDGRIAVGGAFSTINDRMANAFTIVDPVTGAPDPSVTTQIINYTGGTPPLIRSMDIQDGVIYIGGRFTHVSGAGVVGETYLRNMGRLSASTGSPLSGWNPVFDGSVMSVDASARGDRVYAVGYFSRSRETATKRVAALSATDVTVYPWTVEFSNVSGDRTGYQQAVREVGDRVWLGGAEHMIFSYDRATLQELSTNITQNGGDFQAISVYGGNVVGGCHCSENVYQGARYWPGIANFHRVEHIDQAGIWRADSGDFVPDFSPQLTMRRGLGVWAIEEASDGSLWLGGDLTHARQSNAVNRWTGGFVRFAARDAVAPQTPTGAAAATDGGIDTVSWNAVPGVSYEVLRGDRVVATSTTTSVALTSLGTGSRYFVRSVDAAGNRSATTAVVVPSVLSQPVDVLPTGSQWSYYFASASPAADWFMSTFDASSWSAGAAPLGWGHSGLGTTLTATGTKPLTSYYRKTFQVQDASGVASLTLTTRADDGIVVYVNGVEVGRKNMPAGAVGHNTYASAAPSAAVAVANPVTISVPGSILQTGTNVVTAEVHSNYRSTPSASFELSGVLTLGTQPEAAARSLAEDDPAVPAEEPVQHVSPLAKPVQPVSPTAETVPNVAKPEEPAPQPAPQLPAPPAAEDGTTPGTEPGVDDPDSAEPRQE